MGLILRKLFQKFNIEIESIPNDQLLCRAITSRHHVDDDGSIKPSFFRSRDTYLSCDMSLFTTKEKALKGSRKLRPWSDGAGLVEFSVSDIVNNRITNIQLKCKHVPIKESDDSFKNYAHTGIFPLIKDKTARQLFESVNIKIIVPPDVSKLPNP